MYVWTYTTHERKKQDRNQEDLLKFMLLLSKYNQIIIRSTMYLVYCAESDFFHTLKLTGKFTSNALTYYNRFL